MSFFWKYTLIFFIVIGFLFTLFLMFKKGSDLFKNKLLFLFLFLFAYNAILILYSIIQSGNQLQNLIVYALSVTLILYGFLIYFCIKHPDKFYGQPSSVLTLDEKNNKYEKTGLSEAFSHELKDKLEILMLEEKLYLNNELRLSDIAELLNISRHHASQVINENFNMSFYDYVNSYRIEEAKDKLCSSFENSSTSISEIAYQCGFNNRVSFYKAFKKITHITPKEFIQKAA